MARKIRPSTLKRMSNDQLKKSGYVRIPGFTKKDGTKVKSHIRMLNPAKGGKEVSKQLAEFAIDMTPIIGDIKAFKEAKDAFSQGDIGSGFLLAGAGTIGLVPGVGDAIAAPIKLLAKSLKKKATKAVARNTKMADAMSRSSLDTIQPKSALELEVFKKDLKKVLKENDIDVEDIYFNQSNKASTGKKWDPVPKAEDKRITGTYAYKAEDFDKVRQYGDKTYVVITSKGTKTLNQTRAYADGSGAFEEVFIVHGTNKYHKKIMSYGEAYQDYMY